MTCSGPFCLSYSVLPIEEKTEQKEETNEEVDESNLSAESIKMVMDHCKCTRVEAVKALKESDGDSVNAILKLSG